MNDSLSSILAVAERAAKAGADELRTRFRDAQLVAELKGEYDYVSEADRASEAAILEIIGEAFPEHAVLAEESGRLGGSGASGAREASHEWIIDPLDGTTNYLQGLPMFSVSIACRRGDETVVGVILDVVHGETYTAVKGGGAFVNGAPMRVSDTPGADGAFIATGYPFRARQALELYIDVFRDVFLKARGLRRCGSAALDLAFTACGTFDGFFEFRLAPWDIAAGALMIEEAGGRVSDLDGGDRFLEGGNVIAGNPGVFTELQRLVSNNVSESRLDALVPLSAASTPSAC